MAKPLTELLTEFWQELEQNKGDRARLRRCRQPEDALFLASPHRFLRQARTAGIKVNDDWLMVMAVLAAQVEALTQEGIAQQMAQGEKPRVSELRFQRLLRQNEPAEVLNALRQGIKLLDNRINLNDLAESLALWGVDWGAKKTKLRWSTSYFQHANLN